MEAWYFSAADRRLRYGDNRPIEIGATHTVNCTPELCARGLHASECAFDALQYAPGPVIWRVRLSGEIVHGRDKSAATERTYIAGGVDASELMRAFARWSALSVAHLWDCPDIVARYLTTGDPSLRAAARDAARAAAWDAARDAAWAAAWAAARAAARDAARDAARAAAWDAAWAAAWAAARAAERDAARAAAWAAARDAAREKFNAMCNDLINGGEWWIS